ncbi:MAG: hypothetical protein AB8G95_12895 [Anaerolineae bacterium]
MRRKNLFIKVSLVITVALLLLLAACQPQIVEVEVTRITEVITEVEVVKEVEVEKIIEVEVEAEVAAEEPAAEEASADDASEVGGIETGSGGAEATGSEEDDSSPFTPTSGKVNSEQQVAQNVSWIQSSGVITDPTTVRVIASRTDDVVLVMSYLDGGIEQQIIVTNQIRRFSQLDSADNSTYANRIYMEMELVDWERLSNGIEILRSTNVADGLACDFCAAGEAGETYSLIIQDQVVQFQIDAGESVESLDDFLIAMRELLERSNQRAQRVWQQTE